MEPVSVPSQRGTLKDPEVLQNVPGHVIPILQREFDDFQTESTKFLDGKTEEDEFIKFRLKQGVYGQRQPDVQMIRVKLPFGGITPEQMESLRRRGREVRAAEKGPHHDAPEHPDAPHSAAGSREGDSRARRKRPVQPRGLRQHGAQRHRRPVGGRGQGRAVRHDALRGRVRALLRAPPDDAGDAAQDQDGLRRLAARPRDQRHPRHRLSRSRQARSRVAARCAARRCWSAAARRSCRAWHRRCTSSWSSTTATT